MSFNLNVNSVISDIVCEFLEIAVHCVLYTRELYPAGVFTRKNKYNVPVQICYQPELSQYITDMLTSLRPLLSQNSVDRVDIVILAPSGDPVERFVLELAQKQKSDGSISDPKCLMELEQTLRAFVLKLNISDSLLSTLPQDCTWCLQVHTKESAAQSMQEKQQLMDFTWITADESSQQMAAPKLTPLKSADSGLVKMQLYVEESSLKVH